MALRDICCKVFSVDSNRSVPVCVLPREFGRQLTMTLIECSIFALGGLNKGLFVEIQSKSLQ